MTLRHSYFFKFPLNSDQFNKVIKNLIVPGVYTGFKVTVSAITLGIDVGTGLLLLNNGVSVENDNVLTNASGVSPNYSGDVRNDTVVMEYVHGSDPSVNIPKIKVLQGISGEAAPEAEDNQVAIAIISLPDGTATLTNELITQVPEVGKVGPGSYSFNRRHYDSNTGEFLDDVAEVTFDPSGHHINFPRDVHSSAGPILGSLYLMAAKMAMEGIYWGNYELSHTSNAFGQPDATEIIIKEPADATPTTVTVSHVYDDQNRVIQQVFDTTTHTMTVDYDYTAEGQLPAVTQAVVQNV